MSVMLKVVNEPPPDVRGLCKGLHQDLAAVVMRCLAKDHRRRYASAADLADDLRRYLEKRPTIARPVTIRERAWLWTKRNPVVAGLVSALCCVLLTAFITITAFWMKAEKTADDERSARERATAAELQAIAANRDAEASLAEAKLQKASAELNRTYLEFARAANWCEEGRVVDGLASFVRTVELAEAIGATDLARVARVNLVAWLKELPSARKSLVYSSQPRDLVLYPDGRRAVVAARGGNLLLWDLTTDQVLLKYLPSFKFTRATPAGIFLGFTFWSAAISPNGKTVVGGGSDGQIWVWDSGKPEARTALVAAPPDDDVWAVTFAPDGTLWATSGSEIQRWDLGEKKIVARATLPNNSKGIIQSLILSSDGKRLFTGDRSGMLLEWDAERLTTLRSWEIPGWITHLAFSPGATHIAATGTNGSIYVIELETGRQIQEISLAGAYGNGVAFAPDRPLLLASDTDGNVRGWNWMTGVPVGVPLQLTGEVLNPRFLGNSDEFIVPAGNAVHRCRLAAMPGQLLLANKGRRIRGLDFSSDGNRLAWAYDKSIHEFNLSNKESTQTNSLSTFTLTIRYDPDLSRNRLFRAYSDGFDVIDLPSFAQRPLIRTTSRTLQIGFTPNGGSAFVMETDKVSRWDPVSLARPIEQFRDPEMPNGVDHTAMDVRPDGKELLIAHANKLVFLDSQTLTKSRADWEAADEILDAKYLPGGSKILVGRRDGVAQICDAASGTALGRAMTHNRAVLSMASSPNGDLLVSGSRDGTARFWDAASGLPLGPPLRHSGPVTHVAFNPKGTQVATGSGNGEVLLWTLPPPPVQGSVDKFRGIGTRTVE
jgi:WD40 repeat protein